MKHRNRMPRWQRHTLYVDTLILLGSGLLWLSIHQWGWPHIARATMEGLPSPWEPWLMKLHGLAMMIMLFLIGRLSATHVMRGWRLHWRRAGGVTLLSCLALLALSGYALYYWVPDEWRDAIGWLHAGIGTAWGFVLLWHRRRDQV